MLQDRPTNGPLLREITLRNILSYGPDASPTPLHNLNVLIGPNGSGKSNLIEAIVLLRTCPGDLGTVIRRGGGIGEWIWKGNPEGVAQLDVVVCNPDGSQPLRHVLEFTNYNSRFRLEDERIENEQPYSDKPDPYFYYRYQHGKPVLNVKGVERGLAQETVKPNLSILAQRREPEFYPEVTYLANAYSRIRVYREWTFGRSGVFRQPQQTDERNDPLEEDFSNLGLFLNHLRSVPKAKRAVLDGIRDLYEGLDDYDVSIQANTVQVFFTEGNFTIPATRLSDGTLRYLCLLAILCDPKPPPLICIEEPELGLHPDVLPKIAELLISAAQHTQLIVTTHSDILVDAMTDEPEAVVVCEKHRGQTTLRRLDNEKLSQWLEEYRLGELWTRGELGGTRW